MTTFKELQEKMQAAANKAVVYQHLVDYLEREFRPVSGAVPLKKMLNKEKSPVPDATIEDVVKELYLGLTNVSSEVERIVSMPIPPPVQAVPPAEPVKKGKEKS